VLQRDARDGAKPCPHREFLLFSTLFNLLTLLTLTLFCCRVFEGDANSVLAEHERKYKKNADDEDDAADDKKSEDWHTDRTQRISRDAFFAHPTYRSVPARGTARAKFASRPRCAQRARRLTIAALCVHLCAHVFFPDQRSAKRCDGFAASREPTTLPVSVLKESEHIRDIRKGEAAIGRRSTRRWWMESWIRRRESLTRETQGKGLDAACSCIKIDAADALAALKHWRVAIKAESRKRARSAVEKSRAVAFARIAGNIRSGPDWRGRRYPRRHARWRGARR
jgi:hypothetical protein